MGAEEIYPPSLRHCRAWSGVVLPTRELGEGAPGQSLACPHI